VNPAGVTLEDLSEGYMGERCGDAGDNERVDGYSAVDLSLNCEYREPSFADAVRFSFNLNLFDTGYVSVINASDDTREGGASYYAGAPFTAVFSVGFEFQERSRVCRSLKRSGAPVRDL
jgi:iron complex outermembrane receptor protein